MELKQNITLSLDKTLLKKVKVLAAQRDMSVTKLLSTELERIIEDKETYEFSKKKAYEELERGLDCGGAVTWTRDELHER